MRIKEVKLKNFKFHQNLEFDISKQNCLLYGENGTGKSSIYEAFYSVFNVYFRDKEFSFNKFKNSNSIEALNAKVILDDETELIIPSPTYTLVKNLSVENKRTIYFANQDLLESIIENDNFYDTVKKSFKNTFASLHNFRKNFESINYRIDSSNYLQEDAKREDNIIKMEIFLNQVEIRANDIINNYFEEKFTINFKCDWGLSDTEEDYKYSNPKIILKIDNEKSLKLNFNEAKLKLSSIAIFFALIKIEEDNTNPLKLLVLDDFLTSLDMANRHYIVEYILSDNGFKDYQKIILTHNLQFYNLILDWLNTQEETSDWDIKNIYNRYLEHNNGEAIIYSIDSNYLNDAERKLNNGEFQNAGNLIRKEFERIIHELEKFYQLGKKEETDTIVSQILKEKPIYAKQYKLFKTIKSTINHCKSIQNNEALRTSKLNNLFDELEKSTSHKNEHLKSILKSLVFYRKIVMNKASHDNPNAETYQKEYQSSLLVIKELKKLLEELK